MSKAFAFTKTAVKRLDHATPLINPRVGKKAPTVYSNAADAVAPFIRPGLNKFYLHMGTYSISVHEF